MFCLYILDIVVTSLLLPPLLPPHQHHLFLHLPLLLSVPLQIRDRTHKFSTMKLCNKYYEYTVLMTKMVLLNLSVLYKHFNVFAM